MEEEKGKVPIEERIKELEEEGLSRPDIVLTLYNYGYPTQEIMKKGFSLRHLGSIHARGEARLGPFIVRASEDFIFYVGQ